jgi:Mg-chelatase subunit ChlD
MTQAQAEVLRRTLEADEQEHMQGFGELVTQALEQLAQETRSDSVAMTEVTEAGTGAGDPLSNERFELHVKGTTNALRQRIAGLLQAESRCRQTHTMAGRKIDARKLSGIAAGDFRVFKKRMEGIKTETAVQIVVDRSGSMSGAPIVVAREACFATALAMQSVPGVSVAVSAFPGGGGTSVIRLSDFGERVERQIAGFESLNASGGTPMVEAMLWGASQLLPQNKPRRLLLVLTDGGYDGPRGKNMVARLTRNGIEYTNIKISYNIAHLFDLYRVIADVRELPQAMFEVLFEALKRQRLH